MRSRSVIEKPNKEIFQFRYILDFFENAFLSFLVRKQKKRRSLSIYGLSLVDVVPFVMKSHCPPTL